MRIGGNLAIVASMYAMCIAVPDTFANNSCRDLITLIDGSEIYGYVMRDDLTTGNVEINADCTIATVSSGWVNVNVEECKSYKLDQNIKDWMSEYLGEIPKSVVFANISMSGDDCSPEYILYDQVLDDDPNAFDKLLIEDGDIIKYVDFANRKYHLNWKDIDKIQRMNCDSNRDVIDVIVDSSGNSYEGVLESQTLRHHRVLKNEDGMRISFFPRNIDVIKKISADKNKSLLEVSPITEALELESKAGGGVLEGVIVENNRKGKFFLILIPSEDDQEELIKVAYSEVKAIRYTR